MVSEVPEDPDGEENGNTFSPTDWDWVMFLSGEINAIKVKFDMVKSIFVATSMACISLVIACASLIAVASTSILNSTVFISIVVGSVVDIALLVAIVFVALFFFYLSLCWIVDKQMSEAKKEVESLEKCRNDIFNRLDDSNEILECYRKAVGKE